MEQTLDKFARSVRPFFFAASIVAIPISMISYLYIMKMVFAAIPMWVFVIIGVSHMITLIAFGLLHDFRRERQNLPPFYQ